MLKHALLEGLKNVIRSFWLSATAVSVLTVSLGSVTLVATLSTIVGFSVRQIDRQISVVTYFREDASPEIVKTTQNELSQVKEVKEIRYVSKEEAQSRLKENNQALDNVITSLQKSNISVGVESLEITPTSSETYSKVEDIVRSDKYKDVFTDVKGGKEYIQNLQNIYDIIRIAGVALIIIFGLISILVMANILRIAVYSYKDEIEIMRLVGATDNYIRLPFIMQGAYFNLLAAGLVSVFFVPLINWLIPRVVEYTRIPVSTVNGNLFFQLYMWLGLTIVGWIAIGIATAYMSTQRYLKL